MKKELIIIIATFTVIGLSIFLILKFFHNYNFIYLVAGVIVPIVVMFISSQYFAGNLFALVIITGGGVGYFYLDVPYNYLCGSLSAYLFLFRMIRYGNDMQGNYIDNNTISNSDMHFLNKLLNSDWYEQNKNKNGYEIDVDYLVQQPFYQTHVKKIIATLVSNNIKDFSDSKYSNEILIKLHATGTIHTLPKPISKNADGLISVGTQMLLNIFSNIKLINSESSLNIENDELNIYSAKHLVERSENEFSEVSNDEFEKLKNA